MATKKRYFIISKEIPDSDWPLAVAAKPKVGDKGYLTTQYREIPNKLCISFAPKQLGYQGRDRIVLYILNEYLTETTHCPKE